MVKIALPSHWETDRGWYTRAGTLQDRTCWRRFITHHHQSGSPTTRFVQTRNICQDRETGVDRCFAGAFQFSKRKSALYSFFPRGGGEFKVVNSTQQLGAYYMMLCGCFSVYQAGKYTPRYDSRGVCVHVFVVVVGIGEYYCDHPIDHLTNSHPISATWLFRKVTWQLASKACKLITWGQFDYNALCEGWGGGVRRWGKIVERRWREHGWSVRVEQIRREEKLLEPPGIQSAWCYVKEKIHCRCELVMSVVSISIIELFCYVRLIVKHGFVLVLFGWIGICARLGLSRVTSCPWAATDSWDDTMGRDGTSTSSHHQLRLLRRPVASFVRKVFKLKGGVQTSGSFKCCGKSRFTI